MYKKFIEGVDLRDKLIFIRNDFNVPLSDDGDITDDTRITESLRTINYAIDQNAKVICASHLGRPKGRRDEKLSLKRVAERLSELTGKDIIFNGETTGPAIDKIKSGMKGGQILLLENLRFDPGEKANDNNFSSELAKDIDVYINDAFGSSHRSHSSINGITKHVHISAMGFLLKKEIEFLGMALNNPPEKFTVILGGSKVSDKISVIENLTDKASSIIIGGAMAYTFLKAKGEGIGTSLYEPEYLDVCRRTMETAEKKGVRILLPVDHIAATKIERNITIRMIKPGEGIPDEMMGLDIGFNTVSIFRKEILNSQMIFWNGPMGVFEVEDFSGGTMAVAEAVAESPAISIAGGGDTVSAISNAGVKGNISHISTGGGASLEFMSGISLPGINSLTED
ncbi:MAG: phosphoglycerate kinase [Acidobacteriota bacterium]